MIQAQQFGNGIHSCRCKFHRSDDTGLNLFQISTRPSVKPFHKFKSIDFWRVGSRTYRLSEHPPFTIQTINWLWFRHFRANVSFKWDRIPDNSSGREEIKKKTLNFLNEVVKISNFYGVIINKNQGVRILCSLK